jgi:hypothetical protein
MASLCRRELKHAQKMLVKIAHTFDEMGFRDQLAEEREQVRKSPFSHACNTLLIPL